MSRPFRALCPGPRWELFRTGAFRCGCPRAARMLIGLQGGSPALGLWAGQPATDRGAHPPEVSGVGAHLGFQVWAPRPLIEVRAHPGLLGLCARQPSGRSGCTLIPSFGPMHWGSQPLIWVCTHLKFQVWAPFSGFQVWAPRPLMEVHTHPGACFFF